MLPNANLRIEPIRLILNIRHLILQFLLFLPGNTEQVLQIRDALLEEVALPTMMLLRFPDLALQVGGEGADLGGLRGMGESARLP